MKIRSRVAPLPVFLLAVATVVVGAGCSTGGPLDDDPFRGGDTGLAYLVVQNNNTKDLTVFVMRYGAFERMGMVTAQTRERYELPRAWVRGGVSLAVRVEMIGSPERFTTETYVIEPGSTFELTVQNSIGQSTVWIR